VLAERHYGFARHRLRDGSPGRGQEICRALSASMEWTWMGHAIISPGWRPTWRGLAHVWCALQISDADLIRITTNRGGFGDEPENSIFNPKTPAYLLKDGCAGR
jgi:hypothetical protein